MKKQYNIIILVLLVFVSCSKEFTELAPISERNAENFYNTSSDMEVAVNAIYNTLKANGTYNQSYWILQELRSDNTYWDGTGLAEEVTVFDKFNDISTSNITEDAWVSSYLGISRANIVLNRIEDIDMDASLKSRLKGEALFLRSFYYYNLAVLFGNIPLILNETASVTEGNEHRQVAAAAVYSQIATDLIEAEAGLPSKATATNGRATKGAAATLLAKVYLANGEASNAETALRRVLTYGYTLVNDYSLLWGVENEYNSESIFEVDFQGGLSNQGNQFTNQFHGILSQAVTSGQRNIPEQDLIDAYEAGDLRFAASIDGVVDGVSTGYTIKFGTTNPYNDDDAPNNWPVFRYADVLLMLAEAIGESDEAYGYINQVRNRAGLAPIDATTPGTFVDKLLHERRVEMAFENHRWPDLLRMNKAESVMAAQGKNIKGRLLYAIPQRELDLNSNFSQNSGY
ncbi:RagB/SusD family nutrient uptake outer membrane protein [Flavobacteriaceae bacterium]|nr:RagB/SusD family nutrient uptake outer membrane protein [Flavobacteriaceae bacterium]